MKTLESDLAQVRNFDTQVIVDQGVSYTIVGGRLTPAIDVDLTTQVVIMSLAGANGFRLSLSANSFRKTVFGGYIASIIDGLHKAEIMLQPFSRGDWAYSAGIDGFVPVSTPITVGLTIGNQAGAATVEVYSI